MPACSLFFYVTNNITCIASKKVYHPRISLRLEFLTCCMDDVKTTVVLNDTASKEEFKLVPIISLRLRVKVGVHA
jgi:hypothetical protein